MKPSIENIHLGEKNSSFHAYKIQQRRYEDYWHYHPEIEITLLVKGRGVAFIGNKTIEFEPGMAFLMGPYLPHNFVSTDHDSTEQVECWGLQFSKEWITSFKESADLRQLLTKMSYGVLFSELTGEEMAQFSKIYERPGFQALSAFIQLIELLNQRSQFPTIATSNAYANVMNEKISDRMERVSQHIQSNYHKPISLTEISNVASMTEQSFSRWFKQSTGMTFIDYLMQLRTTVASNLLINTSKPMSEIAAESGFNSSSSFNRAFLKLKKCSPRTFRKNTQVF